MGCRRNTPGCGSCCPGTIACPACAGVLYSAGPRYLTLPALGIASGVLTYNAGFGGWRGCFQSTVMGYPLCNVTGGACTVASISAGFFAQYTCINVSGAAKWQLKMLWNTAYPSYACAAGTSIAAGDQTRAVNTTCTGDATVAVCSPGASASFAPFWQSPNTCVPGAIVTFSGAPLGLGGAPNLYLGTSATVKDTP